MAEMNLSECQVSEVVRMNVSDEPKGTQPSDDEIEALATAVGWDAERLMVDLLVKYDQEAIAQLNPPQKLDLYNRLKGVQKRQSLGGDKR